MLAKLNKKLKFTLTSIKLHYHSNNTQHNFYDAFHGYVLHLTSRAHPYVVRQRRLELGTLLAAAKVAAHHHDQPPHSEEEEKSARDGVTDETSHYCCCLVV